MNFTDELMCVQAQKEDVANRRMENEDTKTGVADENECGAPLESPICLSNVRRLPEQLMQTTNTDTSLWDPEYQTTRFMRTRPEVDALALESPSR